MKKLVFLTIITFVAFSCNTPEKEISDSHDSRFERILSSLQPNFQVEGQETPTFSLEERMRELRIPGVSIAFAYEGEVVWAKGFGMADIAGNRKMNSETMLLAGSISKPVAAIRAHQMVESGVFDLDANVNDYLKSWQLPDNEFTNNEKVTLRRILNHTAGLTVWGFPGYDKGDEIPSTQDVLDGNGNTDAVRVYKEPGESWMYSGGGYTIMQLMISENEDISFVESLQQNVLDKMNMSKSTYANPLLKEYHEIAATGYRRNGNEVEGKWPIYPEMAAAGLWTTPTQLVQYGIEIQEIYANKKDGILKYETVEEMLEPGMNDWGLGPQTDKDFFGHGGADEGFRANLVASKEKPIAMVVMVNSDFGLIIREIELAIAKEYGLNIQPDRRKPMTLSEEEMQAYVGKYELEIGPCEISLVDGELQLSAPYVNPPVPLYASTKERLFHGIDGTWLEFKFEDGEVVSFEVDNYTATKQ